jgi:hypothetical protein
MHQALLIAVGHTIKTMDGGEDTHFQDYEAFEPSPVMVPVIWNRK